MKKSTILIVDDDDGIRESLKDFLDDKGYNVLEANNGVKGLKIFSETKVDLILLDIAMPRMDGYMFMEHLQQRWEADNRRFNFPSILVLTSIDKQTDIGLAKNLGAQEFMGKPFELDELFKTIKTLLKK